MRLTPVQSLILGLILLILIGTALLSLPTASAKGRAQPFMVAFFTATSAVTTTGLVVVDTGTAFSRFGQVVLLILFQIGGLGYMIVVVAAMTWLGVRISLFERMLLRESVQRPSSVELLRFVKIIFAFTLAFEIVGALLLTLFWAGDLPLDEALFAGVFHAISAFCTTGFCLFPEGFSKYADSSLFMSVLMGLCLAGASGFFVLLDLYCLVRLPGRPPSRHRVSVHTKLSMGMLLALLLSGTGLVLLWEPSLSALPASGRFLRASFQAVSAVTTTGFNTLTIGELKSGSLFLFLCLMLVGASPGGTGGGIKTTSLGVMLLSITALFTGKEEVTVFRRKVPTLTVYRAFILGLTALLWVTAATLLLTLTEDLPFLNLFFEVVSALGTVGLSTGITPILSDPGKYILCATMLAGRIGFLAIGYSVVGRTRARHFSYPETEILVG